jgi:hypothetical protein
MQAPLPRTQKNMPHMCKAWPLLRDYLLIAHTRERHPLAVSKAMPGQH